MVVASSRSIVRSRARGEKSGKKKLVFTVGSFHVLDRVRCLAYESKHNRGQQKGQNISQSQYSPVVVHRLGVVLVPVVEC
jgi:hypothetical protein